MSHAAHGLGQGIAHAALQTGGRFRLEAHAPCNLVGGTEAHAVDFIGEAVWIFLQNALALVAVGLVDLHGKAGREARALQENQRGAHFILHGEGFGDHGRLLRADAGNLRKPVGLGFHHIQRCRAEVLHDELGRRRADASDQAGAQILLHAGLGFRAQELVGAHLDLFAVIPVLGQFALQDYMFARIQKRQNAHGAGAPRALNAEGRHRPSVGVVSENDLLYRSFKLRHPNLPVSKDMPSFQALRHSR